jgi:hypothetical protein
LGAAKASVGQRIVEVGGFRAIEGGEDFAFATARQIRARRGRRQVEAKVLGGKWLGHDVQRRSFKLSMGAATLGAVKRSLQETS